jgi:hypothetical protein
MLSLVVVFAAIFAAVLLGKSVISTKGTPPGTIEPPGPKGEKHYQASRLNMIPTLLSMFDLLLKCSKHTSLMVLYCSLINLRQASLFSGPSSPYRPTTPGSGFSNGVKSMGLCLRYPLQDDLKSFFPPRE